MTEITQKSLTITNLELELELSQIVDILHYILLPEQVQKYLQIGDKIARESTCDYSFLLQTKGEARP